MTADHFDLVQNSLYSCPGTNTEVVQQAFVCESIPCARLWAFVFLMKELEGCEWPEYEARLRSI